MASPDAHTNRQYQLKASTHEHSNFEMNNNNRITRSHQTHIRTLNTINNNE